MESDLYFKFENQFRGSREEIISRLSSYDGIIEHIVQIFDAPKLLDIGSGRGEWIEKCSSFGVHSIGIDINKGMINFCRNKGLNIIEGNALEVISKFDEDSFAIVSAFHLIEHLSHDQIKLLLEECKRVLMPGGILILETPSIDNLFVATRTFYIDPTHITPINPDALLFNMESLGFDEAKFYYINGGNLIDSYKEHSLMDVLSYSGRDVCFLGTIFKDRLPSFFAYEDIWSEEIQFAKSTSEIALAFDERYNRLINKQQKQEQDISLLVSRLEYIKMRQDRLYDNLLAKIYRKSKSLILKLINPFKRILLKFCHLIITFLLGNSQSNKSLSFLRILANILRLFHFDIYSSRLMSKLNQVNKIARKSSSLNSRLIDYYYSSNLAQRIYLEINSKKLK